MKKVPVIRGLVKQARADNARRRDHARSPLVNLMKKALQERIAGYGIISQSTPYYME